jgi:hypothetical protein
MLELLLTNYLINHILSLGVKLRVYSGRVSLAFLPEASTATSLPFPEKTKYKIFRRVGATKVSSVSRGSSVHG